MHSRTCTECTPTILVHTRLRHFRDKSPTKSAATGGGASEDFAAGDDYVDHDSYMGITLDGSTTQGTVTRMHYGFINDNTKNIRLEPSVSGIIVGGDGDATDSGTTARTAPATIGVNADIDLITLDSNQVTVAGELEATSLDINGAASIAGAVTDVTDLTASGTVTTKDLTLFEEDSNSNADAGPTLTLQRKTSGTNPQANDQAHQPSNPQSINQGLLALPLRRPYPPAMPRIPDIS